MCEKRGSSERTHEGKFCAWRPRFLLVQNSLGVTIEGIFDGVGTVGSNLVTYKQISLSISIGCVSTAILVEAFITFITHLISMRQRISIGFSVTTNIVFINNISIPNHKNKKTIIVDAFWEHPVCFYLRILK